jgi:C1A family cysteine protease
LKFKTPFHNIFLTHFFRFNLAFKNDAERQYRFTVFNNNLKEIEQLNAKYPEATFGITNFTHLTTEEFSQRLMKNSHISSSYQQSENVKNFTTKGPTYFDWRSKNVVTQVKDQEDCGSCYAFGTAAVVESYIAIKTRTLHDLSEQQILDCDTNSEGCGGGNLIDAFEVARNFGLVEESSYPYEDRQGSCKSLSGQRYKIDGEDWLPTDENFIANTVYANGPVVINIDCPPALQHYTGGIFSMDATTCHNQRLGAHAPVIVGYGSDYWIIKNSWGTWWGESGYFRMKRGINACGINRQAISVS